MFQFQWVWHNMGNTQRKFILAVILQIIHPATALINPKLTELLVDWVVTGVTDPVTGEVVRRMDLLIPLAVAMCLVTAIRTAFGYFMIVCFEQVSQQTVKNIRVKMYQNMQANEMEFFDSYRTGGLMTRMTGDLDMVRHSIAGICRQLLNSLVLFVAALIFFFVTDWLFTLCILIITPVIFMVSNFYSRKIKPMYRGLRERMTELNTAAQENISGNKVIKAFAREDYEISKFDEKNKAYRDTNIFVNLYWMKFFPIMEMAANFLTIVVALVGGLFIINGRLTAGELMAMSSLTWAIAAPMRQLGTLLNDTQRFFASASKIIEIYYQAPTIHTKDNAYQPEKTEGDISFENVTFRFGKNTVLDDVSFHIKPGQTVAFMGATGCGKTTVANLILRFYDVKEGHIRVDGVDVRDWDLRTLRGGIGMATQDVFLFSDTAEGNVCYGVPDMSEEDVVKYAKMADADDFIRHMTEGYDTIIGERGVGLSGGQKQRIALARALAVRPAILILDDTTSAVDMETEKYIQGQLNNLDFPCTKIVIGQRISSVKNADQIFILDHGKIVESGTHSELLKKNGYYREIFNIQNSGMDVQDLQAVGVL